MQYEGNIQKMKTEATSPVTYELSIGAASVGMNELIGHTLELTYQGKIHCLHCGKQTKTSFSQGYCYSCFTTLPQTDSCIMHPELDRAHLGISRDLEWAQKNSLIPHYVYLAFSDKIKVGVTRHTQVPTRWIDQGASQAIKLAKTPNRHIAGTIEVALKKHFSDKTNPREMLKSVEATADLADAKQKAIALLHEEHKQYVAKDNTVTQLTFPTVPLDKVSLFTLQKEPTFKGKLIGIKGQYLLFEGGKALNIRNHGGYLVTMKID